MKIVGLQKNSFVDYPKKIAAVLFMAGCNFNCWYCHNMPVCNDATGIAYEPEDILSFLSARTKMLDAVVITGGEPLVSGDLLPFIRDIRALGYAIKLDTNGTFPDRLSELISAGVLDYIAMDIKATFDKYPETVKTTIVPEKLKKSIQLIMNSGIDYEFRTTVIPQLTKEDLIEMVSYIKGARLYALQQYRKPTVLNSNMLPLPLKPSFFSDIKTELEGEVQSLILRGL